jgi:hypothetical protein
LGIIAGVLPNVQNSKSVRIRQRAAFTVAEAT